MMALTCRWPRVLEVTFITTARVWSRRSSDTGSIPTSRRTSREERATMHLCEYAAARDSASRPTRYALPYN